MTTQNRQKSIAKKTTKKLSVKINDSIERMKKERYNAENKKNSNIHTDSCQSKFHGSGVVQSFTLIA